MARKPAPSATSVARYDDLVTSWLAGQHSVNTRAAYRSDLAAFGRWCVRDVSIPLRASTADIVSYQAACVAAGQSPATLRRHSSALSSFFQFAVDSGTIADNPVFGTNRPLVMAGDPSPTMALDADFVEQYLLGAARFDPRLHALVGLLVFDGLKLGEALAIDTDDVGGRLPHLSVKVVRPEGPRRLVLHRRSSIAVRRCAGERHGEPLFVSGRPTAEGDPARRLTRFGADHLIRQIPGPDGPPLTSNALRRFHVAAAHAAGDDLETIRIRAGVSDRRTARRYLTTDREHDPQQHAADHGSDRRSTTKEV